MAYEPPPVGPGDEPGGGLPAPLTLGQGRTGVRLTLRALGRDLILFVTGGAAHVGAVAVVAPPGSLAEAPYCRVTVVPGHAEGPLAEEAAARIAAASGRTCVVVAGIHQDQATRAEIDAIVANVQRGVTRLEAVLARG